MPMMRQVQEHAKDWDSGGSMLNFLVPPLAAYYPNSAKTYLIVKEEHEHKAKALFADTNVHVTINGKRHLVGPT